jgi:hypothetical protein
VAVRLALETNRYTELCRGSVSVVETVELADEVWFPSLVLGELRAGFAVGSQGTRNEAVLRRFLLKSGVGVCSMPMNRPLIITALFIGTAETRHSHPDQRCVDRGFRPATFAGSACARCTF